MNQTIKKKSIKQIPTELNYFYNTNKRINQLKKQGNKSRLLILALIIWNLVLTLQIYEPDSNIIPQFTDKENELIMIQESIPPYDNIGE